jgi:hypothetical protein
MRGGKDEKEDGEIIMNTNTIKFSHRYHKMPLTYMLEHGNHIILGVIRAKISELNKVFLDYDTKYYNRRSQECEHFPLTFDEALIIVIFSYMDYKNETECKLWQTIRRYTRGKEKYYKGLIGKQIDIEIMEK